MCGGTVFNCIVESVAEKGHKQQKILRDREGVLSEETNGVEVHQRNGNMTGDHQFFFFTTPPLRNTPSITLSIAQETAAIHFENFSQVSCEVEALRG